MVKAHIDQTNHPLTGVTVPLVTPLKVDGSPDLDALPRLINHVLRGGVDALFLLGSNGENTNVHAEEIGPLVRAAADCLRSLGKREAVPLLCGTGGVSTREAVKRGEAALAAGADALVCLAPFYFIHSDDELVAHFQAVAKLGAPLIVYNIPRYTQNPLTVDVFQALFEMPNVIGVKDSSGDDALFSQIVRLAKEREGVAVSQGAERRLAWALAHGASGITPGLANVAPWLCAELFKAAASGRSDDAARLQERLDQLGAIHRLRSGIAGTKGALSVLGVCPRYVSPPFLPLSDDELAVVEQILMTCGLIDEKKASGA